MVDTADRVVRLRYRNFQSLKKVDLELGDITLIQGKSDSGKTSALRGAKAMVMNRAGHDFITFGEDKCVVAMDNVAWIQSKKDNSYQIGKRKWEKCGRGVPDDVSAELNMGEFEFGKDVKLFLNFSGQLDPAFIVQGNPADNAKVIGSISNIHIIYNALREAEKDTKAIKRQITVVQEQSDQYREQLDRVEPEFEHLELLYAKMSDIFERAKKIDDKMTDIASLKARLAIMPDEAKLRARIKVLEGVGFDNYAGRVDLIGKGKGLLDRYLVVETELKAVQVTHKLHQTVSTEKGYKALDKLKVLLESASGLRDVSERIVNIEKTISVLDKDIAETKAERNKLDVCENCGAEREYWNI